MQPILNDEMLECAVGALKNERFLRGKSVKEFEDAFAKYIGVKYAVAVNSGTSALYLSLVGMGVQKGDYVITTPATFVATANVILYLNAKPLFADISNKTYTIDPLKVEECIITYKEKVKAVIPVHLYGYPCEMDNLLEIARKYHIQILEDACQGHGASWKNTKVGAFGAVAAFSFYPSKNMTVCGDGGMITTNDDRLADQTRSLRDVGRSKDNSSFHMFVGYTARMNTVNAALGKVQLKYLEEWNKRRRYLAELYGNRLKRINEVILPPKSTDDIQSACHLYVIRSKKRNLLKKYLEKRGIECGIHYPMPVHLQPPYRRMGFSEGMYPNSEKWAKEVLSLPMFPELSEEQVEYVAQNLKEFYREHS